MDVNARRARSIRRWVGAISVVLLGASLSGCFSVLHAAQRVVAPDDMQNLAASPGPRPRPASTASPEAPLVKIPADQTVANGIIRSPGRVFYGRVSVISTITGGYELKVSNYRAPDGHRLIATLSSTEIAADSTCDRRQEESSVLPALGTLGHRSSVSFTLAEASGEFWRNDPTFLTNVLLLDPLKNSPGCLSAIAANARISWDLPDMNPDFHILDTGETAGARGDTNSNFQQLISYTVAEGDGLPDIAARFSITLQDLQWLNPNRVRGQPAELGETLNLARYLR